MRSPVAVLVPLPSDSLPLARLRRGVGGLLSLAIALTVGLLQPSPSAAQQHSHLVAEETALPDLPYGPETVAHIVCRDGSRSVAVTCEKDQFTVVDGHPGSRYDALLVGTPLLSADGQHCAYVGRRVSDELGEPFWYVVLDGDEKGPYYAVQPHSLALRPDGQFLACVVKRLDEKQAVCVRWLEAPAVAPAAPAGPPAPGDAPALQPAGRAPTFQTELGKWYDRIGDGAPGFSPDGRYLAYAARYGGAWHVLLNGVAGNPYDSVSRARFSGSGGIMAYVGRQQGRSMLVTVPVGVQGGVGGAAGQPVEEIRDNSVRMSFDGVHAAFVAGTPGRQSVYLDNQLLAAPLAPALIGPPAPFVPYEEVAEDSLSFSPDGRHLAFAATRAGKWFVVRDGVEGPGFDGFTGGPPVFSPDGKRLAWVAERVAPGGDKREHVERVAVVDDVVGQAYDHIPAAPVFSADSKHYAYVAESGGRNLAVVDEMEGRPYRYIRGTPVLSADGSRCAYTAIGPDEEGRFSATEEVARDPTDPAAGFRLLFDRSPQFLNLPPEVKKKPVKMLMVVERVVQD